MDSKNTHKIYLKSQIFLFFSEAINIIRQSFWKEEKYL